MSRLNKQEAVLGCKVSRITAKAGSPSASQLAAVAPAAPTRLALGRAARSRHQDQGAMTVRRLMRVPLAVLFVASILLAGAQAVVSAAPAGAVVTVPGAPTLVKAVGVNKAIDVSWKAPASNGGSRITGYTVAAKAGTVTNTCHTTSTPILIAPTSCSVLYLTNGKTYSVVVRAMNTKGSGTPSAATTAKPTAAQNCSFFGPYAANLQSCNLTGANLTKANLTGANLSKANLSNAILTKANLIYGILTDANLTDANLTGANLIDANLIDANLTDANLTDANLEANLGGANLGGATLTGANLKYVQSGLIVGDPATLPTPWGPGGRLPAGDYASLDNANLSGFQLEYADLDHASLEHANLTQTNLAFAYLDYADLEHADLTGADISATDSEYADLTGVTCTKQTCGTPTWGTPT